jgi:hypothetical protein
MNRGDHQERIFLDDADRHSFLSTLEPLKAARPLMPLPWLRLQNQGPSEVTTRKYFLGASALAVWA